MSDATVDAETDSRSAGSRRPSGVPGPSFWGSALRGAFTVVLLAVLALAVALGVVPRVMGGAALTVLSDSMEPTYSAGDMVVSVPDDRYGVGDVVTFQPRSDDPTLITHRVVSVEQGPEGTRYVTRGDANGADDEPLVADQVMGEVIYSVPAVGHLAQALGSHRSALISVAGLCLLGYGLYALGSSLAERRRRTAATPSARTTALHTEGE